MASSSGVYFSAFWGMIVLQSCQLPPLCVNDRYVLVHQFFKSSSSPGSSLEASEARRSKFVGVRLEDNSSDTLDLDENKRPAEGADNVDAAGVAKVDDTRFFGRGFLYWPLANLRPLADWRNGAIFEVPTDHPQE